jgi:hypothetical protein
MKGTPVRALQLIGAIRAIVNSALPKYEKELAINSLPTYRSRGHGHGKMARNFWKPASRYMPHQNKKEMARRVRQLELGVIS